METPAVVDFHADRWVAFRRDVSFIGFDFTAATFALQVRALWDAAGSPLVNLATVTTANTEGVRLIYGGTDTFANHLAAGRIASIPEGRSSSESEAISVLHIRVNETTMEGLPLPDDTGDIYPAVYDLHVTPSGGTKDLYLRGEFNIRPGATQ